MIGGTLNYVTGYTGFSGKTEEQSGNYLALKITAPEDATKTTVELLGGTVGHPIELDSDMNIVLRIGNKYTQKIKVVTTVDDVDYSKVYKITGLTLKK